jgi:general secretion pathway protein C
MNIEKLDILPDTLFEIAINLLQSDSFKHIIIGLTIILSSICAGKTITAWLDYKLSPEPAININPLPQAQKSLQVKHTSQKTKLDYKAVIERNLFGGDPYGPKAPPQKEEQKPEDLPLSQLKLKLKGTIVDKNGKYSTAIIEDLARKSQDLYHVGDKVKNALIKKIARTYVIINTGSRDEILAMNPDEMGKKSSPQIQRTGSGKIKVSRKLIEHSMSNLASIMQDALIKPYFRRGKVEGFKITQIRNGSLYSQLGLKNGDVLIGINNEKLDDPKKLLTLYDRFKNLNEIKLKIKRYGRQETLSYQLY